MACCRCCEKTGACCTEEGCSQETCADCEDAGGVFQGVDTVCVGEENDECPCEPPADPSLCEKCIEGSPTSYCPEGQPYCCDGVCQEEECLECECELECCIVIQDRNTCEGGTEGEEAWGLFGLTGGWSQTGPEDEAQQLEYFYEIIAEYLGCEDGVHRMNVSSLAIAGQEEDANGTIYLWYDVEITLEDGCPSSVSLGEPDDIECAFDNCFLDPLDPDITFICDELENES